jgi:hypothetical protein
MCVTPERLTAFDVRTFLVMSQLEWIEAMVDWVEYL